MPMSLRNSLAGVISRVLIRIAPPPVLTLSEWADRERRLSSESSAEPGRWNTDRAPYQRGMMDCLNDPDVERITVMTSSQVGKTELLLNIIGYYSHYDPCPMLLIQPTLEMAETFSKDRLAPMIRDAPALTSAFGKQNSKNGNNTLLHKKFAGGQITLAGANSPASLASRPVRVVLLDEVDRYPASAGDEGDPLNLAAKRTNNFYNRKIISVSTPLIKNISRIERLWEESDQRRFNVKCPHCEDLFILRFPLLKWQDDDPNTTVLLCPSCSAIIDESEKPAMLASGKWIPEKPFRNHAGFHINELYSPWRKWSQIVADFLEAKKSPLTLKVWVNTALGETWEEKGEAPEWQRIYDRREPYDRNRIPKKGLFLTCSVDVQADRLEAEIKAWGRTKENWSIDKRVLHGPTNEPEVWDRLTSEILNENFEHEAGGHMRIRLMGVDSGFNTQRVYEYVRKFSQNQVIALKGDSGIQSIVGTPKSVDISKNGKTKARGLKIWRVGTDIVKSDLYALLRIPKPADSVLAENGGAFPDGYCHFPEYEEEYFKQLTAESLVKRLSKGGFHRYEWIKTRDRNEALDLHVYNRALASIVGIDNFKEAHWKKYEANIDNSKAQSPESPGKNNSITKTEQSKDSERSPFWDWKGR
jgi:phage terminase large subunit GpA-like protein